MTSHLKKTVCVMLVITLSVSLQAQVPAFEGLNNKRHTQEKNGLLALAGWSTGNILYGLVAKNNSDGSRKYFHEMNALFNGFNLTIAGVGLLSLKKKNNPSSLFASFKQQQKSEKIFLFNAGLDVAYVVAGAYLKEKGKTSVKNDLRFTGYGNSIMLQGAVLAAFDGLMFFLMHKNGKSLQKHDLNLSLSREVYGIIISYQIK